MSDFSMTPEEEKSLQEIAGIVAEESAVVMSTLLDKKIEITVQETGPAHREALDVDFPETIVIVECKFATGFEGINYFFFNKELVAKLSDLMMMGDGTAEFSDDHIDAIQEGVNQMMGAAGTAMGARLGKPLDYQPSEAKTATLDEAGLEMGTLTCSSCSIRIEGQDEGKIALLVPYDFIKEIMSFIVPDADVSESAGGEDGDIGADAAGLGTVEDAMGEDSLTGLAEEDDFGVPAPGALLEMTELSEKERSRLELLMDIKLDVSIELGRTRMLVRDILELGPGSVIELEKMAGETVDLLINDKKLAEGEVVVVDENFGVRITHLVSMEERIKMLQTA